VIKRRINVYSSKQAVFYEFILPILIMVLGISVTSIDFFLRTPSRILQPDRVSAYHQTIVFDKNIEIPSKDFTAKDFASSMPISEGDKDCAKSDCWAKIVYTN